MTSLFKPSWKTTEERKKDILKSIRKQDVPVSELFPYIASYFSTDKEVIKKLISKNPNGLGCASKELQDDEELATLCCRFANHKLMVMDIEANPTRVNYYESNYLNREPLSFESLKYVSKRLRSSKPFIKKMIPFLPSMVKDPIVSETVAGDEDLLFKAMESGQQIAFSLLSKKQREDEKIVKRAVKLIPALLSDIPSHFLCNREITKQILKMIWPDDLALILEPSLDIEVCTVLSDVLLLGNPESLNSFAYRTIGVEPFNKVIKSIGLAADLHTEDELLEVFNVYNPSGKTDHITDILLARISMNTLKSFPTEGHWFDQKVKEYIFKMEVKDVTFSGTAPDKKARKIARPF